MSGVAGATRPVRRTRGVAAAVAVVLLLGAAAGSSWAGASAAVSGAGPLPLVARVGGHDTVLVAFRPGVRVPARARLVSRPLRIYRMAAPTALGARTYAARLRARRGVVAAAPNFVLRSGQAGAGCLPAPATVDSALAVAVRADAVVPPDTTKPIAILDTGVDGTVPELAGKLVTPFNVRGGSDVSDGDGHGTRAAAIAAGKPGKFRGVSPTSPILPVKVLDAQGEATAEDLIKGIDAAVDRGAGVINISSSGPAGASTEDEDQLVQMAIGRAFNRGALVVAAIGNEGLADLTVPAAYAHVLSVGAAGGEGRASFSNFGLGLDLLAPGVDLLTPAPATVCPLGYGLASGTSFAAPAVAGALALLDGLRPKLDPSQRFDLIRRSARDLGPRGYDQESGFGVLDVAAALAAPVPVKDTPEVNDHVYWVTGSFARSHPARLTPKRRRAVLRGTVEALNDPTDVYPVRLKRGDTFKATLSSSSLGAFAVGLWSPRTPAFALDSDSQRRRFVVDYVDDSKPVKRLVRSKIPRAGLYFVSVEAPDRDASNPSYRLVLERRGARKKR